MPTRLNDLFVYACLIFVLLLAFFSVQGCAPVAPPQPPIPEHVPVHTAVRLDMDGAACSGVAVGPYTVLTAKHCTTHGAITVERFPGLAPTRVIGQITHPELDLAVLQTEDELGAYARPAPYRPLPGTVVHAVGFGCKTHAPTVHVGLYVSQDLDGDLRMAMGVCFGDSGGPVFDDQGRLFAIISRKAIPEDLPLAFGVDVVSQ
jgi:hypothetical protein